MGDIYKLKMNDGRQIDQSVSKINTILTKAAGLKVISRKTRNKQNRFFNKPWFSDKYSLMKENLIRKGNDLIRNSTNNTLRQQFFFYMKKKYKTAISTK